MTTRWTQEKNKSLFSKLQSFAFNPISVKEMDDVHFDVESQELLCRIKGNIQRLSDANLKMEFMLEEVQSIVRKRK